MNTIETIRKEMQEYETLREGKRNDPEYLQGMFARIKTLVEHHKEPDPKDGPLRFKQENDYELVVGEHESCWIEVNGFAVYVHPHGTVGVGADIFETNEEMGEPLDSAYADNSDKESDDDEGEDSSRGGPESVPETQGDAEAAEEPA